MEVNDARTAHGYSPRPLSERRVFVFPFDISFHPACGARRRARSRLGFREKIIRDIALSPFSVSMATEPASLSELSESF